MISLGSPKIDENEIEGVEKVLEEGILSTGEIVSEFEEEFANFVGKKYSAAVCSGSMALELAIESSSLEEGEKMIVSPFNCGAVLYSMIRKDIVPVFADINPRTYNLDPDEVETTLRDQSDISGIMATHLYGQPAEMDRITELAEKFDLVIIEDFAQSPGAKFKGEKAGSFGDISVCSFGATKNLTTAEGGMVLSNDKNAIQEVKELRTNTENSSKPLMSVRMNDIEAALGINQLQKYEKIMNQKRKIAEIYRDKLPKELYNSAKENREHVYHGFPIELQDADKIQEEMERKGVETGRVYSTPLHKYDCLDGDFGEFPKAEKACKQVLLLPIHANVSEEEAVEVVETLKSCRKSLQSD